MSTIEKELKQLKVIRQLRVDTLRRKQTAKAMEKSQAARRIEESQDHFSAVEQELIEAERSTLSELTGGGFVKVDKLIGFTKLQQHSVKKIKETRQEIDNSHLKYEQAQARYDESCLAVNVAEKKLLGLEEVLSQKLWK